jgi:Xaa-Pro aminopeptidase
MRRFTPPGGHVSDILIYGDSRSPSLRHEVPLPLPDPIAFVERNGQRWIFAGSLDIPRMRALGGYEVLSFEELGLEEVLASGKPLLAALSECVVRACQHTGATDVTVPRDFAVETADHLRASGVSVHPDGDLFDLRRRSKTAAELAGIRRGQHAAEAAMAAIREGLAAGGTVMVEELRAVARRVFVDHGCVPHDMLVIAPAGQGADPHEEGHGPIPAGVPIVVDVFPRDLESGAWGDLTRTLCVGEPPAELVEWHRHVREAQRLATEAVRPGVTGEELNRIACRYLAQQGYATRLGRDASAPLEEGFIHYLGHGVGLELHEAPTLDEGGEALVPGDVFSIEPGLYRPGWGGCRIEDLVLVTDDGYELLTDCPYDLVV